jgi:ferredoxin
MADKEEKVPENVMGPYYVTVECVACEACVDTAPANFKMNDDGSHAFVFQQPGDATEKSACDAARDECPVDAIGNDG